MRSYKIIFTEIVFMKGGYFYGDSIVRRK